MTVASCFGATPATTPAPTPSATELAAASPSAGVGAPGASATPSASPSASPLDICRPVAPTSIDDIVRQYDRTAALVLSALDARLVGVPLSDGIRAVNATAPCLRTTTVTTGVLTVTPSTALQAVTLVWHDGTRWHVHSLRTPGTQRWLEPRWALPRTGAIDVFAATGTGAEIELIRLTDRATTIGTWTGSPLELSLVAPGLTLARSFAAPVRERQSLLEWDAGTIRERARRTAPSVRGVLTEFVDALRRGDRSAARALATNDAAVDAGLRAAPDLEGEGAPTFEIDQAEAAYWDALPAASRPARPTAARFVSRRGPWRIVAERGVDHWRVAAVEPTPIGDGGPATSAFLDRPTGVAVDGAGNVYVAVPFDHRVRKISPSGVITSVAGTGAAGSSGDGGPATAAKLTAPWALALDARGALHIADATAGTVRRIATDGTISTVASSLEHPTGVAVDPSGALFVAESSAGRVRRIAPDGATSFVAVSLDQPWSVAVDARGNTYVAEMKTGTVRRIAPGGASAALATLSMPLALAVDQAGDLYAVESGEARVRRIAAGGSVSTVAGSGAFGFTGDGGPATAARFHEVFGLVVIRGVLYVADTGNGRVRAFGPDGIVRTLAGSGLDEVAVTPAAREGRSLEAGVVALVQTQSDVGPPAVNAVVLADARVVQGEHRPGAVFYTERRLTAAALDAVRRDLRETAELASSPYLALTAFPGEPLAGFGISSTPLTVGLDGRVVRVTTRDCCFPRLVPSPYAGSVQARVKRFTQLHSSLSAASWTDAGPTRYAADRFRLITRSDPASAASPNAAVDVDALRWPASGPVTEVYGSTCTSVSRADVMALRRALGRPEQDIDFADEIVLPWARQSATFTIRLDPVAPGEEPCFGV